MGDRDLVPSPGRTPTRLEAWRGRRDAALANAGLMLGSSGLAIAAFASGHAWLLIPSVLGTLVSAAWAARPLARGLVLLPGREGSGPQIGLGATVDPTAVIEPGAQVEMGATVQDGAIVRSGAVVGMGSTVQSRAIIEEDAIVGWGVTVQANAVVSRGAAVGAGSLVQANAVVPANARIGAGSTVVGRLRTSESSPAAPTTPALTAGSRDERDARVDALCDRVEAELAGLSSGVDEFLANPRETIHTVRRTCHDLLQRERGLRKLLDPREQERIRLETATLEARIAAEADAITRQRLQGALAAIGEHQRQRDLLLRDANRLEAEHTRLVWTLEGLLAHVIRLRTTEAGAPAPELDRALAQLREEVSAISGAMEHVQGLDLELGTTQAPGEAEGSTGPTRSRERA